MLYRPILLSQSNHRIGKYRKSSQCFSPKVCLSCISLKIYSSVYSGETSLYSCFKTNIKISNLIDNLHCQHFFYCQSFKIPRSRRTLKYIFIFMLFLFLHKSFIFSFDVLRSPYVCVRVFQIVVSEALSSLKFLEPIRNQGCLQPCTQALFNKEQDTYHRPKHESRIRTSTALIPHEINMRGLKHNSQHFSRHKLWFSYAYATRH